MVQMTAGRVRRRILCTTSVLLIVGTAEPFSSNRAALGEAPPIPTIVETISESTADTVELSLADGTSRRTAMKVLSSFATFSFFQPFMKPLPARAAEVRAPTELLRPACRVKIYIDRAIYLCQSIQANSKNPITRDALQPLADFLLQQNESAMFMTTEEEKLSKRYLTIDTSTAWQAARLKEREQKGAESGIDYTSPYDRFNTAVQQFGDKSTFRILRQRQSNLERSNAMRAAFNAYTNNLVFGDAYQLNVVGDAKKSMVRNNALPNVNSVVVSDLDLRDLYRNQVLQNIDDARAELEYQMKADTIDGEREIEDVLQFLVDAQKSCQDWLNFIPKADVEEAMDVVLKEASN